MNRCTVLAFAFFSVFYLLLRSGVTFLCCDIYGIALTDVTFTTEV